MAAAAAALCVGTHELAPERRDAVYWLFFPPPHCPGSNLKRTPPPHLYIYIYIYLYNIIIMYIWAKRKKRGKKTSCNRKYLDRRKKFVNLLEKLWFINKFQFRANRRILFSSWRRERIDRRCDCRPFSSPPSIDVRFIGWILTDVTAMIEGWSGAT